MLVPYYGMSANVDHDARNGELSGHNRVQYRLSQKHINGLLAAVRASGWRELALDAPRLPLHCICTSQLVRAHVPM
jgi:hypothetical protein